MKPGARALGVAESYRAEVSTLGGAVVRADRTLDGLAFASCTVGGSDATAAVGRLWRRLDREDVRVVLLAGIAPAWYNIFDLHEIAEVTDRPAVSVSFDASDGLAESIRAEFDGEAADRRLATYRAQPERRQVAFDDETVYVRSVGIDDDRAAETVRTLTPEGGRPEPLRVARLAARAGDDLRRMAADDESPPTDASDDSVDPGDAG